MATIVQNTHDGKLAITSIFERNFMADFEPEVFREIAREIAKRYVDEHYQEIAALIDQNALATLSVAEAAAKVRETLEKKIPDKILHVHHENTKREFWQRGILGGMRRVG